MSKQEGEIPYGDRHFVVVRDHTWGADTSLVKAFNNSKWRFTNPFEECCNEITFANRENLQNVSKINEELREAHAEANYNDGRTYDFTIVITNKHRWEFAGCDSLHGAPNYNWIGEGEMPNELERIRLEGRVSESTGLIKITESVSSITRKP